MKVIEVDVCKLDEYKYVVGYVLSLSKSMSNQLLNRCIKDAPNAQLLQRCMSMKRRIKQKDTSKYILFLLNEYLL